MNHRRLAPSVIASIIVSVVAFSLGYGSAPRSAKAPIGNSAAQPAPAKPQTGSAASMPAGAISIPVSVVSLREKAPGRPTIEIEYPQFPAAPAAFDEEIASSTLSRLAEFRAEVRDNQAARAANSPKGSAGAPTDMPADAYSFAATWTATRIDGQYISFVARYDSYAGGANGRQEIQTFNYDLANGRVVQLSDLFSSSDKSGYLAQISREVRSELADSMNAASDGGVSKEMLDAGTAPIADNFKNFTFTDHTITFYFPKYAVAPGSFGEQTATIPR